MIRRVKVLSSTIARISSHVAVTNEQRTAGCAVASSLHDRCLHRTAGSRRLAIPCVSDIYPPSIWAWPFQRSIESAPCRGHRCWSSPTWKRRRRAFAPWHWWSRRRCSPYLHSAPTTGRSAAVNGIPHRPVRCQTRRRRRRRRESSAVHHLLLLRRSVSSCCCHGGRSDWP